MSRSLDQPRRVLLLVDVQAHLLKGKNSVPAASSVHQNIERVLAEARSAEHPPLIVHVRNTGEPGEPDEPNSPGSHLVFPPLPNEPVVDKRKNNAFAGTELGVLVPAQAEVVVVGMQSDYCVRATCVAALGRGNVVILIKGAHATLDRNEIWNGGSVTRADLVEAEIETELEEAGVNLLEMKFLPDVFSDR